ncbi:MAG: superoxide dismutase family protein [Legionella sp.]|nr:superoxide dismutase family protein [Legionella sp.]
MNLRRYLFVSFLLFTTAISHATERTARLYTTGPSKTDVGQVTFRDTPYGLLIIPAFSLLPPGLHGFHLHQYSNCGDAGMKAGGHYDPLHTQSHQGPYAQGHSGDLPVLYVAEDGKASIPSLAPRLKTNQLDGLTVMIHSGGDNYTDQPSMGGGGTRIACGIIH